MNKFSLTAAQLLAVLLLVSGILGIGISITSSLHLLFWIGLFFAGMGISLVLILRLSARPIRAIGFLILGVGIVAIIASRAIDLFNRQGALPFDKGHIATMGILYALLGNGVLLLDRFTSPSIPSKFTPDSPITSSPIGNSAPKRQDDFSQVAGIGPKRTKALHEVGIYTYAQLAKTPFEVLYQIVRIEEDIKVVGDAATWPRQARYLMSGDLKRLHDYQARLIEGRDPDAGAVSG